MEKPAVQKVDVDLPLQRRVNGIVDSSLDYYNNIASRIDNASGVTMLLIICKQTHGFACGSTRRRCLLLKARNRACGGRRQGPQGLASNEK
jgi:hypothetical protein